MRLLGFTTLHDLILSLPISYLLRLTTWPGGGEETNQSMPLPPWSAAASASAPAASGQSFVSTVMNSAALGWVQSSWTDYSDRESLALRSAIAAARVMVETSLASVHSAHARLQGHADAVNERLSSDLRGARDTASSAAGAINDGAQEDLSKRAAMLRSAWDDWAVREERALKGGIASVRGTVDRAAASAREAQARVQEAADTRMAHTSLAVEQGRSAASELLAAYPETRVAAATLLFCRFLGMLPGNGTWLGRRTPPRTAPANPHPKPTNATLNLRPLHPPPPHTPSAPPLLLVSRL